MGAVPVINVVILVHNIFTQGTVVEENWHEYRLYIHCMETGMFAEDIFSYLFYFIQFLLNLELFVSVRNGCDAIKLYVFNFVIATELRTIEWRKKK